MVIRIDPKHLPVIGWYESQKPVSDKVIHPFFSKVIDLPDQQIVVGPECDIGFEFARVEPRFVDKPTGFRNNLFTGRKFGYLDRRMGMGH